MRDRKPTEPMLEVHEEIEALSCLECGELSEGRARGWKALIGGGFEDEPRSIGIFCPACAAREFEL